MSGCSSTTLIQSSPSGAKLYLNGELAGATPYAHTDTKILGSTTQVRIEKEGFESYHASFSRDEEVDAGAIVGGVFFLVPFLWTMKYKPVRTYELISSENSQARAAKPMMLKETTVSKADQLRELAKLLEDQIITQEEFEKEKKKILESDTE